MCVFFVFSIRSRFCIKFCAIELEASYVPGEGTSMILTFGLTFGVAGLGSAYEIYRPVLFIAKSLYWNLGVSFYPLYVVNLKSLAYFGTTL